MVIDGSPKHEMCFITSCFQFIVVWTRNPCILKVMAIGPPVDLHFSKLEIPPGFKKICEHCPKPKPKPYPSS